MSQLLNVYIIFYMDVNVCNCEESFCGGEQLFRLFSFCLLLPPPPSTTSFSFSQPKTKWGQGYFPGGGGGVSYTVALQHILAEYSL